ncbi:MAG TPA: type VI secretion system tube protein Hcp [Phycisphaerae bacterium]|nr:type VI secretion system tube protein Hcp [Phycisphaerae bacterium]
MLVDELNVIGFLCLEPDKGPPIEGEAQDSAHKGEIQVISYSLGVSNARKSSPGEGDTKPDFQEMTLSIVPSKASPALMLAVARSDHFKKATLSVRKRGASKTNADYLQVQLCDVYVTSYSHGGGDAGRGSEAISLNYTSIDYYYAQQDADGTLKTNVKRAWSLCDNKDMPSALPYTPKK